MTSLIWKHIGVCHIAVEFEKGLENNAVCIWETCSHFALTECCVTLSLHGHCFQGKGRNPVSMLYLIPFVSGLGAYRSLGVASKSGAKAACEMRCCHSRVVIQEVGKIGCKQ
jgi:hypothetical protein